MISTGWWSPRPRVRSSGDAAHSAPSSNGAPCSIIRTQRLGARKGASTALTGSVNVGITRPSRRTGDHTTPLFQPHRYPVMPEAETPAAPAPTTCQVGGGQSSASLGSGDYVNGGSGCQSSPVHFQTGFSTAHSVPGSKYHSDSFVPWF